MTSDKRNRESQKIEISISSKSCVNKSIPALYNLNNGSDNNERLVKNAKAELKEFW